MLDLRSVYLFYFILADPGVNSTEARGKFGYQQYGIISYGVCTTTVGGFAEGDGTKGSRPSTNGTTVPGNEHTSVLHW